MPAAGPKSIALKAGESKYFTGKPCKRGHVALRYTCSGKCVECGALQASQWVLENREGSRAIKARWSAANPEKVKAARVAYRADKAADRERRAAYRLANHAKVAAQQSAWYEKNKAEVKARMRANTKRWAVQNPDKRAAGRMLRRAREQCGARRMSGFDRFVMEEAAAACKRREEMHGDPFHVDHIVPLAKGGEHRYDNIQVIPASLNMWKGDRMRLTRVGEWVYHV